MALCIYKCGEETNNKDGVCGKCAVHIHVYGYPRAMSEEEFKEHKAKSIGQSEEAMPDMNNVGAGLVSALQEEKKMAATGVKICTACGNEYKPTSNVQKRCPACKAKKSGTGVGARSPRPVKQRPATTAGDDEVISKILAKRNELRAELSTIEKLISTLREYGAEISEEVEA